MKKIICMALIFALSFTITACGSSEAEQNPGTNYAPPAAETEVTKETGTEAGEIQTEIPATEAVWENTAQEVTEMKMRIQVGDTTFTATLAENSSVDARKS